MSWKYEPVAKLRGSGESMILRPIARTGEACPNRTDGGLPKRASEEARLQ